MELTPSQTVGPFFSHALTWEDGPFVVAADAQGAFWLRGTVYDGAGSSSSNRTPPARTVNTSPCIRPASSSSPITKPGPPAAWNSLTSALPLG